MIARPPSESDVSAAPDFRARCRRIGWATGLPGLALILGLSVTWDTPRIEAHLAEQADAISRATVVPGAEPWLRATAEGRDLIIAGEAPDAGTRDLARERLARIEGVRRLVGPVGVVEPASPFLWTATRTRDGVDLTGFRPAEMGAGALAERLRPALEPGAILRDRAHAALGAPPDFSAAATYALARLRALAPASRVVLEDMRLSVIGEAASVPDDEALRAALADLPVGYSLGRIEVLPAVVSDFRFVVSRPPGGGIALSGHVVSEAARQAIREEATPISETGGIEDRMHTARGLPQEIDAAAMASFALQLAGLMQEGSVTVADATMSLNGIALDAQAVPDIEARLRDAMPAGLRRGAVALTTRPLSPYRISIRRDTDSVLLTGHLPDAGTRETLLASLRARLFRERLIDRTRLGQGAPTDLASALQAATGSLALLATGEVRIADRSITLAGESLYPQSARRIRSDLPGALPEGWSVDVAVATPGVPSGLAQDACAEALGSSLAGPDLTFSPGSVTLKPAFYLRLDALAALSRRCPSLRLTVSGHPDPAGSSPAPKPAVDMAVDSTASLDSDKTPSTKGQAGKVPLDKGQADKVPADKTPGTKAPGTKPLPPQSPTASAKPKATGAEGIKPEAAKLEGKPEVKPTPSTEPEPGLAQQRALVIVEYLLQAGFRPDQLTAAPAGTARSAAQGVGFAIRP